MFGICFCLTEVENHVHHRKVKDDISQCVAVKVSEYKMNDSCTPISTYYASRDVEDEVHEDVVL